MSGFLHMFSLKSNNTFFSCGTQPRIGSLAVSNMRSHPRCCDLSFTAAG